MFTTARGRDVVFWQSPRNRKQARPNVRTPTARAAGIVELEIVVDSHEQYPYRFTGQQVRTVTRALPCGDYGIAVNGRLVASVERKSLPDLVASLTGGKLRYALAELAALPRAAVVVEDRYSAIFKLDRVRPAQSPTGSLNCRCDGPTWRSCSAKPARWARSGPTGSSPPQASGPRPRPPPWSASPRSTPQQPTELGGAPDAPEPSTAEIRAWARTTGITVPDRGRLRPEIWTRGGPPITGDCHSYTTRPQAIYLHECQLRSPAPDKMSA